MAIHEKQVDFLIELAIILSVKSNGKRRIALNEIIRKSSLPVRTDYVVKVKVSLPSGKTIEVDDFDAAAYEKAVNEYQAEEQRILELFQGMFFEYFEIEDNPKRHLFFNKVWEKTKEKGYQEAISMGKYFVDLIK